MLLFTWMNWLIICTLCSLARWNTCTYLWSSDCVIAVWWLLILSVRIQPCLISFLSWRNILVLADTIINTISIIHACWKNTCIYICVIWWNHLPLWIWRNLIFWSNSTSRFSPARLRNILRCQFCKSLSWWGVCLLLIWCTIRLLSPL